MDIQNIIDLIAAQLQGETALIQIQVGNKYYVKRIGDMNQLTDNPERVTISDNRSFFDYMETEINRANVQESTRQNHYSTLKLMRKFRSSLLMGDIDLQFISEFDAYMRNLGYKVNTIAKHMKILKKYLNLAIDNDIFTAHNPFRKYKIKQEDTHKESLTERELTKLERKVDEVELTDEERTVAHSFLFSVYSGLRFSDIIRCTKQHIKNLHRNKWLVMRMKKTDREVRVPISKMFGGKATEIVASNHTTTGRLFQLPCNSRTNLVLSRVMKKVGIRKHLSFHSARYTCATLMLYRGVNLTTIQRILGHQNIKTTQVYSAVTDSTIYRDVKRGFRK